MSISRPAKDPLMVHVSANKDVGRLLARYKHSHPLPVDIEELYKQSLPKWAVETDPPDLAHNNMILAVTQG